MEPQPHAGRVSPTTWNEVVLRGTIANAGIIREYEGAYEDAEAVAGARAAAEDACEVKAPPRSSKDGPVAVAGVVPYQDACLTLDS